MTKCINSLELLHTKSKNVYPLGTFYFILRSFLNSLQLIFLKPLFMNSSTLTPFLPWFLPGITSKVSFKYNSYFSGLSLLDFFAALMLITMYSFSEIFLLISTTQWSFWISSNSFFFFFNSYGFSTSLSARHLPRLLPAPKPILQFSKHQWGVQWSIKFWYLGPKEASDTTGLRAQSHKKMNEWINWIWKWLSSFQKPILSPWATCTSDFFSFFWIKA